jgi:hypothetical protein
MKECRIKNVGNERNLGIHSLTKIMLEILFRCTNTIRKRVIRTLIVD